MTSPLRAPVPQRAPEPPRSSHPKPYLRVAPEPNRRRRTAVAVASVVIVVFGSLLASAVFQSVLVRGQLHLDNVNRRTERTRLAVDRDRVQVARLQSPARLETAAAHLGMVPATRSFAVGPGPDAPVATGVSPADDPASAVQVAATTETHADGDAPGTATTTTTRATSGAKKDTTGVTGPTAPTALTAPTGRERASTATPKGPVR